MIRLLNTQSNPERTHSLLSMLPVEIIDFPLLRIQSIPFKLPQDVSFDACIFTSPNAVHCFFKARNERLNVKHIYPIGSGTEYTLQHYGIIPMQTPEEFNSEGLLRLLGAHPDLHQILLITGENGLLTLQNTLQERHISVTPLFVYRRIKNPDLLQMSEHDFDLVLITSEMAILYLFEIFPKQAHSSLREKCFIVYSNRLASILSLHGVRHILICQSNTLAQTLENWIHEQHA